MRHQIWFALALAACAFCLCGCGALSSLTKDTSLDKARDVYRDNLAELAQSGSDTAQATQASAEALVSIAEKLDQVIENTAPRRSRGVGSSEPADVAVVDEAPSPPEDAEPVSTPVMQSTAPPAEAVPPRTDTDAFDRLSEKLDQVIENTAPRRSRGVGSSEPADVAVVDEAPNPPEDAEPVSTPVMQSIAPPAEAVPPRTDTDAFDRLSEKLDQLTSKLDATRSTPPGNDVRTPDGTSVDVKSYIVDHGTGRFSYEGDIAAKLSAMGFNADEVSCLTLSEQHKLYDAWLSAHPPVATGAAVPAPAAAPGWRCTGSRCYRVR